MKLSSCSFILWVVVAIASYGEVVDLGQFAKSNGGFNGPVSIDANSGVNGAPALVIDVKLKEGDRWMDVRKMVDVPYALQAIKLVVKSDKISGFAIRLVDSTGQTFLHRATFASDDQWHEVALKEAAAGAMEKWGGAKDGVFHWPCKEITITVEAGRVAGREGQLRIQSITADADKSKVATPLQLKQTMLGNVFTTEEPVRIGVISSSPKVTWTAENFFGEKVAEGSVALVSSEGLIEPAVRQPGYYLLKAEAVDGNGTVTGRKETTFVRVRPATKSPATKTFGVMTHFAQNWDVDIMPLIAKAGIGRIRDELYWNQVEAEKGKYSFPPYFDAYMAEAKKVGIETLIVMDFANPFYDGGLTPHTPEGREAYAKYGQAILEHYGKQIQWLEIWNEYNGTWCKGPAAQDRPKYYAEMLKVAYQRIKEVRPDVQVLGGAPVLLPLPYFEGIFRNGGLDCMDALVIHPYRGSPEGVDQEIGELESLEKKYSGGKVKPIWTTETGRVEMGPDGRSLVARYLVRMYTLLLSTGHPNIYWYLLRDYGQFESMGLLHDKNHAYGPYAPAPAYAAYSNLIQQLGGAAFQEREATTKSVRIYRFDRGGTPVRVCWATIPSHVIVKTDAPLTLIDMMGGEKTLTPIKGEIFLTLNMAPVYLLGKTNGYADRGQFMIEPEQLNELLAPPQIMVQASGGSKELRLRMVGVGVDVPLAAEGKPQAIALPGKIEGEKTISYELVSGNTVAGAGAVTLRETDPVTMSRVPQVENGDRLSLTVANLSQSWSYDLTDLEWTVSGKTTRESLAMAFKAGHQGMIELPVSAIKPYEDQTSKVTVVLKDRPPLTWEGSVSYNPCPLWQEKSELTIPLRGAPGASNAGMAAMGHEANAFHIRVKTAQSAVTLALGEGSSLKPYVFTVTKAELTCVASPDGTRLGPWKEASVSTRAEGADQVIDITLPWKSIPPLQAQVDRIRLGISVGDEKKVVGVFGEGMRNGFNPAALADCQLIGGAAAPATLAHAVCQMGPRTTSTTSEPAGSYNLVARQDEDYTNVQGRNQWWYGFYDGTGGGEGNGQFPSGPYSDDDFKPMKYVETVWGYEWTGGMSYLKLTRGGGHPSTSGDRQVWSVRRWKSNQSGLVRLSGTMNRLSKSGDGTYARILVDGVVVATYWLRGEDHRDFETVIAVKEGTLVDLAITPGPKNDTSYDETQFDVRIEGMAKK